MHRFARIRSEKHRGVVDRDFAHRFQGEIVAVNVEGFQRFPMQLDYE
jgi:hypothetical protein